MLCIDYSDSEAILSNTFLATLPILFGLKNLLGFDDVSGRKIAAYLDAVNLDAIIANSVAA